MTIWNWFQFMSKRPCLLSIIPCLLSIVTIYTLFAFICDQSCHDHFQFLIICGINWTCLSLILIIHTTEQTQSSPIKSCLHSWNNNQDQQRPNTKCSLWVASIKALFDFICHPFGPCSNSVMHILALFEFNQHPLDAVSFS